MGVQFNVWVGILFLLILTSCSDPDSFDVSLNMESLNFQGTDVPVHANIDLPAPLVNEPVENLTVKIQSGDGEFKNIPGQIQQDQNGNFKLWWIVPNVRKDHSVEWTARIAKENEVVQSEFEWKDIPGKRLELFQNGKRVFSYEYVLDDHFEKGKTLTANNKPFYHIYDRQGEHKITNGPEEGAYSHHRGIMIGWRNVKWNGQELSFWGMEDLTVQKHIEFTQLTTGPVFAHMEALIHWNDSTGNTIVEEHRHAIVYSQSEPGVLMIDFASTLKAVDGPVVLDGDPEHGGIQFRAHNDVAEDVPGTSRPVYYFHQDGIDPHVDFNLPWVGMSYGLNNKTYSILQMDHPENPKPTIWSAYRDYGRYGAFFKKNLKADESFTVQYRFRVDEDKMPDRDVLSSIYEAYIGSE